MVEEGTFFSYTWIKCFFFVLVWTVSRQEGRTSLHYKLYADKIGQEIEPPKLFFSFCVTIALWPPLHEKAREKKESIVVVFKDLGGKVSHGFAKGSFLTYFCTPPPPEQMWVVSGHILLPRDCVLSSVPISKLYTKNYKQWGMFLNEAKKTSFWLIDGSFLKKPMDEMRCSKWHTKKGLLNKSLQASWWRYIYMDKFVINLGDQDVDNANQMQDGYWQRLQCDQFVSHVTVKHWLLF